MEPISLAVVGAGTAFWNLHLPVLKRRNDVRITAVISRTIESGEASASRLVDDGQPAPAVALLDEQLPEVDAALVAVPIAHTGRITSRLLEAGRHVFAEKPIAENIDEAESLLDASKHHERVLVVGENFRLQPAYNRMDELAKSGLIGDPRLYFLNDLHFTPDDGTYAKTKWRQAGEHAGGYLIDGGSHTVAGLREMTGRRQVKRVHAVATSTQDYLSQQPDTLLVNLEFEDGLVGHMALGYGVHDHESRHPKIYGTAGTLCLTSKDILLINGDGTSVVEKRVTTSGFAEQWDAFIAAVVSGDRSFTDELSRQSVEDLRILDAALRSARTGQAVELHP